MEAQTMDAKVVITGVLEFRDDEGNLVKTTEIRAEVPMSDLMKPENADERSK